MMRKLSLADWPLPELELACIAAVALKLTLNVW
jgi:hypothetical protein